MIEKFHHLLKPIRDLEQNWSVDLAEELTQALQSLSEQMITFGQNGDKIIDFSKAALIIQGSAHVYSKKVPHQATSAVIFKRVAHYKTATFRMVQQRCLLRAVQS